MDPASLVISIASLYTTCRDCYSFFTTMKGAEVESSNFIRELEIQQSILKAWGFHWEIQEREGDDQQTRGPGERKRTKLLKYLQGKDYKAEGVFNTLSALADTLTNQDKLIGRYGLRMKTLQTIEEDGGATSNVRMAITKVKIKDAGPVISEIESRFTMLRKAKWALRDRDDFRKLISELKSHSDSLYRLCPENAFESMNVYLMMECLARYETPEGLKWFSNTADEHAKDDEGSSVQGGYRLLASAANLKALVNENRGSETDTLSQLAPTEENPADLWYLGKGLAFFEDQVVYVEMRDYRGPPVGPSPDQVQRQKRKRQRARLLQQSGQGLPLGELLSKEEIADLFRDSGDELDDESNQGKLTRPADPKLRALIKNYYKTFREAKMSESVAGLDVAGMIDHAAGEHAGHCSILYKLPGTIGMPSRQRPPENLKLRAPVTMNSLLGSKEQNGVKSMLGARFEMARKLVRAVCVLHSSGWLHKNIRAESVLFFPEHVSTMQEDRYEMKVEIDVAKPILMGYIFSRPDDIPIKPLAQPPVEPDDHYASIRRRSRSDSSVWSHEADGSIVLQQRSSTPGKIYGHDMTAKRTIPQPTTELNISGFMLDDYQHPAKHADPLRPYRHAYDVYSLGVLLIEIGLWEKLKSYETLKSYYERAKEYDEEDHYERRRWICREYLDRLRWACGNTYADVVLSCLMVDSSDDEMALASERELCARIIADLEGCQA